MRSLLVHLRAHGLAELRQIADCWDVPLTGRTSDDHIAHLYRTMRDPWTVRDRVERLDPAEWAIIEALLARGDGGLSRDALPATTGLPAAVVATTVEALQRCGILAREEGATRRAAARDEAVVLGLPRELATAFGRVRDERLLGTAIGPETPLRALLSTLEGGELEEAAEAWGLRVTPGTMSREALTDEVLARVGLPDQARAVAQALSPGARRVLGAVREAGGRLALATLRADLRLEPQELREAARTLHRRLLIWHTWEGAGGDAASPLTRTLIVPRDIVAPRRARRDAPPPLDAIDASPEGRPTYQFSAAWDLLTMMQRLTQGLLTWREGDEERNSTALRRLAPALWLRGADGRARPGYASLLLALARQGGLLRVEGEELIVDEAALESWRGLSFAAQTQALFIRWCEAADWPEGPSQEDLQLANVDWRAARAAFLVELRACQVGEWYDAATLTLRIARQHPNLLGNSFSAARASGPAGTREEVTTAATAVALHGALVPLGLLAEGAGPQGRPALTLTPVGAWLLDRGAEPVVRPAGDRSLAVGADAEVLLLRPTPRRLWALGAIGELIRLDTVSSYRLTEASVRRGLAAGLTAEQIATFLERGGGEPLPPNLAFLLQEWMRGHAGVRLARAVIVRPDDPAQAERLRAALARHGQAEPEAIAGGRLLVQLPGDEEAALLALLRDAGFAPRWGR